MAGFCLPVYGTIRLAKSEEVLYHFQESGNAWRFNFSFMSKKYIRLDLQKHQVNTLWLEGG